MRNITIFSSNAGYFFYDDSFEFQKLFTVGEHGEQIGHERRSFFVTGQLAQMNLHVRRKLSELFLQRVQGSRERETDMEAEKEMDRERERKRERQREDSVLTSLNERKLSVSARSKIN